MELHHFKWILKLLVLHLKSWTSFKSSKRWKGSHLGEMNKALSASNDVGKHTQKWKKLVSIKKTLLP